MMKHKLGWMVLGAATLSCSGRYEVGGMNTTAGTSAGAGNPSAAGGADARGGPIVTAGSATMNAGEGAPGPSGPGSGPPRECTVAAAPKPLTGPFAEPSVIWGRVARLTGSEDLPVPELPETTTYDWAGSLVPSALAHAHRDLGTAPGIDTLLRQWLELAPDVAFDVDWGGLLAVPQPALQVLLLSEGGSGRTGIFTEPSWLSAYSNISQRGLHIERALFSVEIPPPPAGIDQVADPTLPDRQAHTRLLDNPVCGACHRRMDATGFALGHFAVDGSYRSLDHGEPIDTKSSRLYEQGDAIDFDGIADFGRKYADSCEATLGFADAFLRAALVINKAPQASQEAQYTLFEANHVRVQRGFVNGGRTYIALVQAYIQSPAGLRP